MIRRILTIARNAFREAVRDRVLYNLVAFVLLLTVAAVFLGAASASQDAKIIVDLGLSALLLFGAFIAIFVGVGLVYKEIERRTVYAVFAKPVGRGEFLVGKYLGLCLTLAVNVAVMGAGVSLALIAVKGELTPLAFRLWPAVALIYAELTVLTALALLFSTFASPVVSAFATLALFVIGHFSADLRGLGELIESPAAARVLDALHLALPNFANFAFITPAAHGIMPSPAHVGTAAAYAAAYGAVLLAAAALVFSRRDFK
ncbi:MAG TPA: ABC transporter permease subunit [Methylomirabilota bacterium]|nr:ABC transporter permease subunit [Methylomirabilota bacterium]